MRSANKQNTVIRLLGHLHGQRVRLTVVGVSIVIYVALSIWNPMYSAIVIDHLWTSIQNAWQTGAEKPDRQDEADPCGSPHQKQEPAAY